MTFPVITNISEILPALDGRDEFVVADKGGYTVIDYRYVLVDSFDHPLRRECRGLKFCSKTGELLARPLHKFFNYGEKPETQLTGEHRIRFDHPHVVMEKMDGSMIHPCLIISLDAEGQRVEELLFMTRMGHTDVAKEAEALFLNEDIDTEIGDYIVRAPRRVAIQQYIEDGFTPVFEYVGPDNRIVEAYEEPRLVLLHVRETENGLYAPLSFLRAAAAAMGVDLAPIHPAFTGHDDVLSVHGRKTGGEGVVLVFDDGKFVKIKTDEYRRLHRIKDDVSREHDLARVILEDKLDDALPLFDDPTRAAVEAFRDTLLIGLNRAAQKIETLVMTGAKLDQKTFATIHLAGQPQALRSVAFSCRKDDRPAKEVMHEFALNACANTQKFEVIRDLTGARFAGVARKMEAA